MIGYIAAAVAALLFVWMFFYFVPVGLWVSALAAGVPIGPMTFIGMRLRKVNPHRVVVPMIAAWKAGLKLSTSDLEAHYLAGGNVERVARALISADKAEIALDFQRAAAIDLAGRDVYDAVAMSVNPRVIETPRVGAVAADGIQLFAIAKVTVRANIDQLVGGATEETVIARVGEGIVSAIGSANSHKEVLENPDKISTLVLEKGLDAGTAFELLSIDIADVDVGKNIGAQLQTDQAEADLKVARARAEERRAMAVAQEQEMTALVQERRAAVVEAEAEIPRAIAEAFRSGQFGVMDYYRMQNLRADTRMREGFAGDEGSPPVAPPAGE
ncbi:MAG: flotillin-like protein FloA [Candidatus Bipolaricaulota bacterium]|nr:MAG: flotillin-like protein FloA [Candidatus Bipolaricaulota bacterium]